MDYFQETEYGLARRLLSRLTSRTVLDVGAERGGFVDACLTAGAERVFAFEPYPPHVEHLRTRFGASPEVEVLDLAIGDRDGPAVLHIAQDRSGRALDYHHSLVAFPATDEAQWNTGIAVTCRSLGSLVREGVIPRAVGLLKIDTEGGDLAALQGLGDLQSDIVMVEYCRNPGHAGDSPYGVPDIEALLRPRGFLDFVFVKRRDELEAIQVGSSQTRLGDWGNLLFIHERKRDRLMPVVLEATAAAQDRLIDRALWFREECVKREQVIAGLEPRRVEGPAGQPPWIGPAPPGERARLASGRPKVSIVTPSFNQARFLEQTIRSVLDQDYSDLEYIIIDGGSTDGSVDIIRRYADRLACWISEPDRGQTDALNKGFARATGDIVAWVNSDDFYYPGAFAAAVDAFKADPELGLLYGRGNRVAESGEVLCEYEESRPFDLEALVYGIDYVLQPTTFMRRQALHEVGPFDPSLHYAFDWELWMRLGERFPARMLDRVVAAGREYPSAKTFMGGFPRVEEIRRIVSRHTGNELSIGYIAYYLSTVLEEMPRAELAGSPLRDALGSVAVVCQRLLSQDVLRDGTPGRPAKIAEIPAYADGWAGPELRLRRVIPETASYLCLKGIHQSDVARVIGPLALRARLNDQFLGSGVVVHPGQFSVYWQLPSERFRFGDDGDLTVITACGLSGKEFGHPKDPRVLSFLFAELSFEEVAPPWAYVVRPESESVAEEAFRAYQRAFLSPEPSGEEVTAYADGWAGPELRLRRVIPETASYLCLKGVHQADVARVIGPLVLRATLGDQPLGVAVVVKPGPFSVRWQLPRERRRPEDHAGGSLTLITSCGLTGGQLGHPKDPRVLSFQFGDLWFEDAAPSGAYVVRPESESAAEEALRAYQRAFLSPEPSGEEITAYADGWAGPELRLRRVIPETASYLCLKGVHQADVARVIGSLVLRATLGDQPLGVAVVVRPGPFSVRWQLPRERRRPEDHASGSLTLITSCGLTGEQLGHPKDPRVLSFQFRDLWFEDAAPSGAYVVRPESESAAEEAFRAYQRAFLSPEPSGEEVTAYADGWAGPELRLRRVIPETASYLCLKGVHQADVARVIGPLVLRATLGDQPLGVAVVVRPGPFSVYWPTPPGYSQRLDGPAGAVSVTLNTLGLLAAHLGNPEDPRVLSFRFGELSCVEAVPQGAYVVSRKSESAAEAALRAWRRAYFSTELIKRRLESMARRLGLPV